MKSPVITIEALSKNYGKHRGIENVSFQVEQGSIFGYLGPNGAGKTTTIRIMLGFLLKYSGNIRIFGNNIRKDLLKILSRTGYLPGELSLYRNLTVKDFLRYFSAIGGRGDLQKANELMDRFGCEPDKKISSLSTGNRQKVGIIQSVMNDPDLIILDEPTKGLDPLMRQEFYDLLRELKEDGKTVLLSSHVLSEVGKVCDKAAIIREGSIVSVENVHQLRTKNYKIMEVRCREPLRESQFRNLKGISGLKITGNRLSCHYAGDMDPLIRALQKNHIIDIESANPGLEEVFIKFYGEHDAE